MKQISQKDFVDMMINYNRCTPITIEVTTPVKMRKTNNPYVGAVCNKKINGMINFIYENSVNNQRAREDKSQDFTPYQRKWGVHLNKCVVGHKGNFYLQVKVENTYDVTYLFGEQPIDYQLLKPFIPTNNSSRQQLDKQVIIRDIKFENINTITIDKQVFKII